jgi:hypothetical protein
LGVDGDEFRFRDLRLFTPEGLKVGDEQISLEYCSLNGEEGSPTSDVL